MKHEQTCLSTAGSLQRPFLKALAGHSPDLQPTVAQSNHCSSAQGFRGDSAPGDTAPAEPSQTAAVTNPAQPWPLRGHTHSPPPSLSTARAGMAQLSQAGTREAREMGALKGVFRQLSVKDKPEVNTDKIN